MAVEYGWTGFESGEQDALTPTAARGGVVGYTDLSPRSGQFMFTAVVGDVVANTPAVYRRKDTTIGNPVGAGNTALTLTRVFFRIRIAPSLNDTFIFSSGGISFPTTYGGLLLNTDRTFACFTWATPAGGANSTTVLALDTWYRADLSWTLTQSGVNTIGTASCSLYTEDGAFLETVTNTTTTVATAGMPVAVLIGNGGVQASTFQIDYDDWWWGTASAGDVATLAFPTATRVAYVGASGQGSLAQWTGDYRTQIDHPYNVGAADNQTAPATPNTSTTFLHATAASQGISGIEGVIVRANLRSTASSGNESLLLGGVAYTVPVTTLLTALGQNGVNFAAIAEATFDGWEFGARNDRGTQLLMANCYLEVLHAGSAGLAPYAEVSDPFSLNIITWTGNGTYQTITGMGFPAQVLLVFPVANASGPPSFMWSPRNGGTRGICMAPGSQDVRNGILGLTADGFLAGPALHVNASGTVYLAVGIRDGGAGAGGYYMTSRSRIGSGVDNWDVAFRNGFSLDLGLCNSGASPSGTARTSYMVGDVSIPYGGAAALTNMIQAVTATGYQVGTALGVNGTTIYLSELLMRIGGGLGLIMHVGTMTPSGASATITGIPFTPVFIAVVKQVANTTALWRSSLTHATANSSQWNGGNLQANGVTAITADGATIGSALAQNGVPVHWIAFGPGSVPPGACIVSLPMGADSGGGLGCAVSL